MNDYLDYDADAALRFFLETGGKLPEWKADLDLIGKLRENFAPPPLADNLVKQLEELFG